jgi:hypothetical protein
MAKSFRNIATYGNHFKATTWANASSMVIYNYGIMGQFEHTPPIVTNKQNHGFELKVYVGKCNEIL